MAKIDPHSPAAKADAEHRQALFRRVREHLDAGGLDLPGGLSSDDVNELLSMARRRQDDQLVRLCRDWF